MPITSTPSRPAAQVSNKPARSTAPALALNHLRQTFIVSLWGGFLLVVACVGFIGMFGLDSAWTWTYVVIYFTCVHSTLVMFGMFGLSKAMAGQTWRYPLIGPAIEPDQR